MDWISSELLNVTHNILQCKFYFVQFLRGPTIQVIVVGHNRRSLSRRTSKYRREIDRSGRVAEAPTIPENGDFSDCHPIRVAFICWVRSNSHLLSCWAEFIRIPKFSIHAPKQLRCPHWIIQQVLVQLCVFASTKPFNSSSLTAKGR